jgi:L-asparaginase
VEVNDDEMNLVASDELNPQKSRILLMLALLRPRANVDIQNLFYSY